MPRVWFALKKSLHCRSEPSEVHDPKSKGQLSSILTTAATTRRASSRSGCSKSIANLKDVVIHGSISKRHLERPPSCSPRSIGSSEFLNPITHEVILTNSRCELRITGGFGSSLDGVGDGGDSAGSTFVGTLRPGTPGPSLHHRHPLTPPRRPPPPCSADANGGTSLSSAVFGIGSGRRVSSSSKARASDGIGDPAAAVCHKCGEQFRKWEALEAHHLSKHAVTELMEGDSSRKIVELICRTSWLKSESSSGRIERVLKVHNTQITLARFEEYRETVKAKAAKLLKKHPRCLADGNELLRFYGATITCSLGTTGSSSLCLSEKCSVCRIIRRGFSTMNETKGGVGVFTTSTSGRAFESIELPVDEEVAKKALMVCRVIAGRVHKPLDNFQELAGQSGFDSLAGKVGLYANIEELYLLNPRALLPCFVVICKP